MLCGSGCCLTSRIVSICTIGGANTDDSTRRVANGYLKSGGWREYIDKEIRPQIAWGCRRFILGCPFGFVGGRPYEIDQYLHAQAGVPGVHPALPWLVKDFVSTVSSLVAEQKTKSQPIEMIAHIGFGQGDPDFDPAKTTAAYRRKRRNASVHPILQAGCSTSFDYATDWPAGGEWHQFAQQTAKIARVYIEGEPNTTNPCWAEFNVVASGGNIDKGHTDGWGVDSKGETIALFDEGDKSTLIPFAKRHLSARRSVGLWIPPLMEMGTKLEDLN